MDRFSKLVLVLGLLVLGGLVVFFTVVPARVDAARNVVSPASAGGDGDPGSAGAGSAGTVSAGAGSAGAGEARPGIRRFHDSLFVADLHDDFFLWSRDFLERAERGHTDLPRLVEGGVDLQVFAAVTKVPRGQNYERNPGDSDVITPLVIAQRWPPSTWVSPFARALHVAERVKGAAAEAGTGDAAGNAVGNVVGDAAGTAAAEVILVRRVADLDALEARRGGALGALLAVEGLHAAEGDPAKVDRLFEAGYRVFGLAHFFDNAFAGSAHGVEKGGLTDRGRTTVLRIEALGGIVDLAHASPATVADVLRMARRPVVVSHTGVRGTCPGPRNLTDGQLRRIAAGGGVVGIGFWPGAVCESSVAAIVRGIRHAADVAGPGHVALGSDWDGSTTVPIDAAGLPRITAALLEAGFSREETARILGGNVRRLLRETLPR